MPCNRIMWLTQGHDVINFSQFQFFFRAGGKGRRKAGEKGETVSGFTHLVVTSVTTHDKMIFR